MAGLHPRWWNGQNFLQYKRFRVWRYFEEMNYTSSTDGNFCKAHPSFWTWDEWVRAVGFETERVHYHVEIFAFKGFTGANKCFLYYTLKPNLKHRNSNVRLTAGVQKIFIGSLAQVVERNTHNVRVHRFDPCFRSILFYSRLREWFKRGVLRW